MKNAHAHRGRCTHIEIGSRKKNATAYTQFLSFSREHVAKVKAVTYKMKIYEISVIDHNRARKKK